MIKLRSGLILEFEGRPGIVIGIGDRFAVVRADEWFGEVTQERLDDMVNGTLTCWGFLQGIHEYSNPDGLWSMGTDYCLETYKDSDNWKPLWVNTLIPGVK